MVHRIPVAAIVIGSLGAPLAGPAFAQAVAPVRILTSAATSSGRVHGFVRDDAGLAIAEASILAVGHTIIAARTDASGRFQMTLPAGDYILRATRAGYLSTYREPVSVRSSTRLERTITLMRQAEAVLMTGPIDGHSHTELAWRLRHLTRSVLRDGSAGGPGATGDTEAAPPQRAPSGSDFTGQVNFVTTASASPASGSLPSVLSRGVAFIVLGAPIGANGDWRVRLAIAPGDSSWNFLGEYESHESSAHMLRLGLSYSAQDQANPAGRLPAAAAGTRSVAGIFARDRWRVLPEVELDYGMRVDRYDYLATPNLFSVHAGLRARVMPATFVTAGVARSMVASGADEFLPPRSNGPWLPPERTFSALTPGESLRAEDVHHAEVGVAREFGDADAGRVLHVRAFRQQTADQIATLFGVPDIAGLGHSRVAPVGSVSVLGWAVGFGGKFLGRLNGQVEYARVIADWQQGGRAPGIGRASASVLRLDTERLHDVTASLEADLNASATRVSVVYRASTAFSSGNGRGSPLSGGRFDVQLHQALPYQPTRAGRLEVLFAVRTLFRDAREGASWYDELLTVGPPLRLMGGIQMRF